MKILIIEDEPGLRELLKLHVLMRAEDLLHIDCEAVAVGSLEEARQEFDRHDFAGVLSDGSFPTARQAVGVFGGVRENWPHLAGWAAKQEIPFVLLSGDVKAVAAARARPQPILGFTKPREIQAAIDALFDAVRVKRPPLFPREVEDVA